MIDRVLQQIGHILGQQVPARDQFQRGSRNLPDVLVTIPVSLFD